MQHGRVDRVRLNQRAPLADRQTRRCRQVVDRARDALSIHGKRRLQVRRQPGDEARVLGSGLGQQRLDAITVTLIHVIGRYLYGSTCSSSPLPTRPRKTSATKPQPRAADLENKSPGRSQGPSHARRIRRSPADLQPQARGCGVRAAIPRRGLRQRRGDDRQPRERHGDRGAQRAHRTGPRADRRPQDRMGQRLARVRHRRPRPRPSVGPRRPRDPRDRAVRRRDAGRAARAQGRRLQAGARRLPVPAGVRIAARAVRPRQAQHQRARERAAHRAGRAPEAVRGQARRREARHPGAARVLRRGRL